MDNKYWIAIYKDNNGLYCARKIYEDAVGVVYMYGWCVDELTDKLVEDGEEKSNITLISDEYLAALHFID